MGIFKKLGLRRFALQSIELIQLIQLYQLNNGVHLYRKFNNKSSPLVELHLSFLPDPVFLRNNISDKAIFKQVFVEKQYTPEKYPFPEVKTILDGGANIGLASVFFAKYFPQAEILAVEPDKGNFELLTKNTQHLKQVHGFQGALWNRNEPIHITNADSLAAGFMVESGTHNGASLAGTTVESLMQKMNWSTIDLMKIDIEGSEKEVFAANTDWLERVKLLIIELHDRYKPDCTKTVFKALERFSYEASFHHENIFIKFNHLKQ
jgi:FkbM family methyltransferase